ncbi:hypothetical protein A2U01_0052806, partial [Trifolium medium]|nr:hypothetical protein [Trifolium medium]
ECDPASYSAVVAAPGQGVVGGHVPGEEVTSSDDVSAGESWTVAKFGLDGETIGRSLSTGISWVFCGRFPDWRSVKICMSSPSSDEREASHPSLDQIPAASDRYRPLEKGRYRAPAGEKLGRRRG